MLTKTLDEIEAWNRGGNYSGRPGETQRDIQALVDEVRRLTALLNTPELHDFSEAVKREAAHQRERWGAEHDTGKGPLDWFWLIGYLAQKAAMASIHDETDKALHHTISTAAALANWHAALSGTSNVMRPGIAEPAI